MKKVLTLCFIVLNLIAYAQKPCEIDTNVTDSLGTYKLTKQKIVYERSFAGNSTDIFFALSSNNGVLAVEVQLLQRSNEFIKATCYDKNSRIYLQLNNGKIVNLLYTGEDSCGTLLRDEKNGNNRILSGTFLFSKENYDELKVSPVTFMRIKFAGEIIDYPLKTELTSELDAVKTAPENYFIDYLNCVEH